MRLLAVRAFQLHATGEVRQSVGGQVLAGINREHSGRSERRIGVDRRDAGACHLGADDHGVRHPLGGKIADIEALARYQPVVLDASLELTPLAQCRLSRWLRGNRSSYPAAAPTGPTCVSTSQRCSTAQARRRSVPCELVGPADPIHVWRVPGTLNWPKKLKVARGRPLTPQPVRLVCFGTSL
jgi:hypothetical protein